MRERWPTLLMTTAFMVMVGCAEMPKAQGGPVSNTDPDVVLNQLDRHLAQLTTNIDGLSKRLTALQQIPETADPIMQELRALDLAGWHIHREQWLLQRDHLQFARGQLQRMKTHPGEKPQLLDQWTQHEQAFEATMGDFRARRHALERERLKVEAQLIERALRGE